ncbi:PH domain-containing protein [Verrucosispora sp. WMMA2044]|uniref:PH domain-containing protein n=1 Tax=Verrucosispora sioxanthis TaxID=2499994 RepID=A0A6M1KW69_9ACTN|nr:MULTISPECIES: PH domain-containing protein [Micromonospora]NEE63119.1 PH domain-containing protein [Verrucosispora sioxanthis]NGM12229.1 PH domain-containing protein [Verrucosispora sioxanthis]WBB47621.1 PH domain-containing protein [Verrucosispora sp. WMMA2044]
MAFPEDVLSEDEHVVLHLHPHWKALIRPVAVLVLAVAAVVVGVLFLPSGGGGSVALAVIGGLALLAVLVLAVWPYVSWRSTHYLFTSERVVLQHGVFSRDRRDIPLSRVNDHSMSQQFAGRLLGYGTLTIESAGERGQSVLHDVPRVDRVQTKLYELVEAFDDRHSLGDGELREILGERDTAAGA